MSTHPLQPRPEVLVCHDLGQPRDGRPAPDLDALLARLEKAEPGAVTDVETRHEQTYGRPEGTTHPVHYITFNAARLRNTEAQGYGYRLGFVSSVSSVAGTRPGLF